MISHFLSPREPPPSMLLDRTDEYDNITLAGSTTRQLSVPSKLTIRLTVCYRIVRL